MEVMNDGLAIVTLQIGNNKRGNAIFIESNLQRLIGSSFIGSNIVCPRYDVV